MNIVRGFPPNIEEIRKHFKPRSTTVYTYGENLYAPLGEKSVSADLLVHETTHSLQQGFEPEEWWKKYYDDPKFRLEQELEAYWAQYQYIKGRFGRPERRRALKKICRDISSQVYGNMITFEEAMRLITKE